jgi:hypothetical protein
MTVYTMEPMTGQVEIEVTAARLRTSAALGAALQRACSVIYTDFMKGGPCVAGDIRRGTLSVLLSVDSEDAQEWLPQLRVLCSAVDGPIDRVTVGPFEQPVSA